MRATCLVALLIACHREPAKITVAHGTAAFVDVTVVPMDADHELLHQTVVIDGTTIVAIGPTDTITVPAGATAIPAAGKWLVPGLADMHVHFNDERDRLLYVANGVTTVRNMWGGAQQLAWRERARKNDPAWLGPWIYTAGPILDGDPPIWPGSHVVHDATEAEVEIADEARAGYDLVKVYNGLSLAAYDALAAAAKRAHLRLGGHLPTAVSLEHAFAAGQTSIEHLTGYTLAAQDATSRAGLLDGNDQRIEIAAHLDASKLPALAAKTAAAGVANCATLVVNARFGELDHPEALRARPENKYVSPAVLAGWDPQHDFRLEHATPEVFAATRTANVFRARLVKALADANAPILAGTDAPNPFVVPGFALHEELGMLVHAGLTPYQALRAATAAPAAWFDTTDFGRVAVGARADLVLLEADPLKDIAATTHRTGVMVRGTWWPQRMLDDKLDALAVSYTIPADRFAGAPAFVVPDGGEVTRAAFRTTIAATEIGEERMAIVRRKDGSRVIVAQAASEPPGPRLAIVREELDGKGQLVAFSVDEDGQHATATRAGTGVHVTGATATDLPADVVLDANLVATMIAFAERARPNAKTRVTGKSLSGGGKLEDVAYTFDRTAGTPRWTFTVESSFGRASGSYEVDDHGVPTAIALDTAMGKIEIVRN